MKWKIRTASTALLFIGVLLMPDGPWWREIGAGVVIMLASTVADLERHL